jgi:hypothetical protein
MANVYILQSESTVGITWARPTILLRGDQLIVSLRQPASKLFFGGFN